jgi:DNA damage-binding protein 1
LISTLSSSYLFQLIPHPSTIKATLSLCNAGEWRREHTISAGNIRRDFGGVGTIQVTSEAVYLLEYDLVLDEWRILHRWLAAEKRPGSEIVRADVQDSYIGVVLGDGMLALLNVESDKLNEFVPIHPISSTPSDRAALFKNEASAIACFTFDPSELSSIFVAVAFWHSRMIHIYSSSGGAGRPVLRCKSPILPAPVRSILFHTFGESSSSQGGVTVKAEGRPKLEHSHSHSYVIVGLTDGSALVLKWARLTDGTLTLTETKTMGVGATPVMLTPVRVDGKDGVLATSTKSVLIVWDKGRLSFSTVVLNVGFLFSCFCLHEM